MHPRSRILTYLTVAIVGLSFPLVAMAQPDANARIGAPLLQSLDNGRSMDEPTRNGLVIKVGDQIHLGFGGLSGYGEYDAYGGYGSSRSYRSNGFDASGYDEYRRNEYSPSFSFSQQARPSKAAKRNRLKRRTKKRLRYPRRIHIRR